MAYALNIGLRMAKVLTICIVPKSDNPLHFHNFKDFFIDFKVSLEFKSSL